MMAKRSADHRPGNAASSGRGSAEETRRKLVGAALDTFGRYGFDGSSTREIAKRAGVNLAAIPYHFGGKEGLHRAVAEHIIDEISQRIGPVVDTLENALNSGGVNSQQAGPMLHGMLDQAVDMLLGHPEASRWAPYVLREQMEPSPSFDVLYDGFMGRAHKLITALLARASDHDGTGPEATVAAFGLVGQLVLFRMGRAMIERRLGWTDFGPEEIAMVKAMLHNNLDAMIEAGRRK